MNAADRRRLTPVLGTLAVVLAVLLIALWTGWGRGARWQGKAATPNLPPPTGSALPAPVVPPLAHYAAVWQHPLFSPTRTPETAAGGDESSGDLQLTGVVMLPGLRMAILHDKTSGRDYRVVEGRAAREGPVLVELQPRSAVVEAAGSRQQLRLIPGPSPEAGNTLENPGGAQPEQMQGPGPGSAMVSRPEARNPGQVPRTEASAEAHARALKARIEAQRRRAQQQDGGQ